MVNLFKKFIAEKELFYQKDKILVAVSGGIDSMVMADLFLKSGFNFSIAHCNFKLRGDESDSDQKFVTDYTSKNNISIHTISFDTKFFAGEEGISVQMAARDLRYNWLKEIKTKHDFKCIAIGHNSDDTIETFFINLTRGTGVHGLTGIRVRNDDIVRPLLFASRNEIVEYAERNNISFREDSSNAETKYLRNKIRHKIIPELEKLNSVFRKKMLETMDNLRKSEKIIDEIVEGYRNKIISQKNDQVLVDYSKIIENQNCNIILFELLKDYGFNSAQVELISDSINSEPGKQFYSLTHRLVKDRNIFVITKIEQQVEGSFTIDEDIESIQVPLNLNFKKSELSENFAIPSASNSAVFDIDKLEFPLKLRKWDKGDRFRPLGMKNFKKVSDFFIDQKVSLPDKEKTWILTSSGQIIWIVNHRIDDRFKVTPETKRVLFVQVCCDEHN